uniref:BHLH domain-containing protein n=1 Tax=Kalanchoe fedtschenkoi TaxID=63787 RepID=A0A7N0V772_KALFE
MYAFENLRKQLALAVRCYQWSYAIFWSVSITQPSVLEWGSGYYNGDIKTRKTSQSEELNADLIDSQRSDQLRELYESLAAGDSNSQARRPSAALSPEDLSDTEWYYLVCMSFVFNIGQGLPGRTFEVGQPIWLCNAHIADSKAYTRSLLAKSASVQTVVCFPCLGGVVEMGVTEQVPEDMNLIVRIKASFLDDFLPQPNVPNISLPSAILNNDMELPGIELDNDYLDANLDPIIECDELDSLSTDDSASKVAPDQVDDSYMVTGGASQVQSWHFVDEEFSNCVRNSFNTSDCISQTFELSAKAKLPSKIEAHRIPCPAECTKLESLDVRSDDLHYQSVVSTLLKSSDQLVLGPHLGCCIKGTSFVKWSRVGLSGASSLSDSRSQVMLKKALFDVGRMHSGGTAVDCTEVLDRYNVPKISRDESDREHLPDVLDERFSALQSLVPSHDKVDKVMLLDATISYLKELEKRVVKLESSKEPAPLPVTSIPTKSQDDVERTSDNYGTNRTSSESNPSTNKRKASHINQTDLQATSKTSRDSSTDHICVSIVDNNVMIEMRCCWRECLLLKVLDAIGSLSLDSHSVQSSTAANGILQLTIKSKFKGSGCPSVGVIRRKLQRILAQSS